jgi:DNA-binding transcriptional regulator YiaG
MTFWKPEQVKEARLRLELTQAELAERLRLAPATGKDTVRSWESGKRPITGPAQVAIEYMLRERAEEE